MRIKKFITSSKAKDLPCVFSLSETHEGMAAIQSNKEAFKSNQVPRNGKCFTQVGNTLTLALISCTDFFIFFSQ